MASSEVDIVNGALRRLGAKPITSLGDDTVQARLANGLLPNVRDAVLRSHLWNCAMNRSELALLVDAPSHGWAHQFQLPTDPYCLRVISVNSLQGDDDPGDPFKVEGRKLLCDSSTAKIRYVGRVTDPNDYDQLLYETISIRMAAEMAYPVTGSTSMATMMWQLYEEKAKEARGVDGQEGTAEAMNDTTLIDVRNC